MDRNLSEQPKRALNVLGSKKQFERKATQVVQYQKYLPLKFVDSQIFLQGMFKYKKEYCMFTLMY